MAKWVQQITGNKTITTCVLAVLEDAILWVINEKIHSAKKS